MCRAFFVCSGCLSLSFCSFAFEIDREHCPNCGGELKIIAAILEGDRADPHTPGIAGRLWTQERACARSCASEGVRACKRERGLQGRAPHRAPARGQALQAEPGHEQSSGLFMPGEESG